MLNIKSTFCKWCFAFGFVFFVFQGYVKSQVCTECPPWQTTIKVEDNSFLWLSSQGSYFSNTCFLIGQNATLFIDSYADFYGCKFWEGAGATIIVSGTANFNSGGGQNELGTCGPNAKGLEIYGTANIQNLIMDVGFYYLSTGVTAHGGSTLTVDGTLSITNTWDTGILCNNCSLMDLDGATTAYPQSGIVTTGNPTILMTNCGIYANGPAMYSVYSNPSSSIFRVENSTFSTGTASSYNGVAAITVWNTGGGPQSFFGNMNYVRNCNIDMHAASMGIYINKISDFEVDGNDVDINQNIGISGVYPRGINMSEAPNADITDNDVAFSGNPSFNFSRGLDITISANCNISGNTFDGTHTGVRVSGNCATTGNFAGNIFKGSQNTGLHVVSGAQLGVQDCHTNRWEGTFSSWGYDCDGNGLLSKISTHPSSSNFYKPTLSNGASGDYTATGCSPLMLVSQGNQNGNGMKTAAAHSKSFEIFPNPTSGSFNISLPETNGASIATVKVTDLAGKILMEKEIGQGATQERISSENLGAGVYLVHILLDEYRQTEKLIVTD